MNIVLKLQIENSQSHRRAQIGISVELDFFVDSYSWMNTEQRTVVEWKKNLPQMPKFLTNLCKFMQKVQYLENQWF